MFVVRAGKNDKNAMAPINRGVWTAAILTIAGSAVVAGAYLHYWKAFYAVLTGVVLMLVASQITEHFTSTERGPVKEVAETARTGPATPTLSGLALGLESSVWAIIAIVLAIAVSIGLGGGNIELTFYLVALTGIGLLSTAGMIVSEDSFGPVSDNAAGVAEMSGEFTGEAERVMVSLDAVGNTTKAVTKGVAIGSAVIASVALFASFIETIGEQLKLPQLGNALFNLPETSINVSHPTTFIGILIGGSIAFIFSALAIRAVGRSAGTVVQEVRRQFREHPGIMDYTEKPEYGKVIAICTTASQRELATPALLAILTPVIVGFGINYFALGAFLVGAILTGQLMANFLSNSGGAWDNAKKYIEDGHEGGKGSEAHKAAVIGDTIGDPFKDTAGPALNPLIKVMNLVSLLILPAIITLRHHTGARLAIAGVALVVLLVAIAFSKRKTDAMDNELPASESAALDEAASGGHGISPRLNPQFSGPMIPGGRGHGVDNGSTPAFTLGPQPCHQPTYRDDRRQRRRRRAPPWPADVPGPGRSPWSSWSHRPRPRPSPGCSGSGYVVESSIGHIRDLPRRADEVPAAYKGESWSRLGVDVDNGFKPLYVVSTEKKSQVGQAEAAGQAGQRGLPGLGRGPRGRVDRLAPARGAGTPGAGEADGVPRDHPAGHRAGGRRVA